MEEYGQLATAHPQFAYATATEHFVQPYVSHMPLIDLSQEFLREHEDRSVRALDAVGRLIKRKYRAALNKKYPPASRPGEYPRKRTGQGRDNVDYSVDTDPKIELFVGIRSDIGPIPPHKEPGGQHLEILRDKYDRKGLDDIIIELGYDITDTFVRVYQR